MALEVQSELPSCRDKGQGEFFKLAVSCFRVEQSLAYIVDGYCLRVRELCLQNARILRGIRTTFLYHAALKVVVQKLSRFLVAAKLPRILPSI